MKIRNLLSDSATEENFPAIGVKLDEANGKLNSISEKIVRLPDTKMFRRSIAVILILIVFVIGILAVVISLVISRDDQQSTGVSYPFQMEREYYFPDRQFMEAYLLSQDQRYEEAYNSIAPTMANFLTAIAGVGGEYAKLDESGADKCMFFSGLCNNAGRIRESIQYLEICYTYYRKLSVESPSAYNKETYLTVLLWLAQNYLYTSEYEESVKLFTEARDIVGTYPPGSEISSLKNEINNALAVLYNKTSQWEKAAIVLANNILSYTARYADVVLPVNTKISVRTMPYSETPVIDFLTGVPEFSVDDAVYDYWNDLEESVGLLVSPEYQKMINSDTQMREQAAEYRKAEIYSLIFSFLELRADLSENERIDAAVAYTNLAVVFMSEFGAAANVAMYTEQALRILDTVEQTDDRADSIAAAYALTSASFFKLSLSGAFESAGISLFDRGIEYYYKAAGIFVELLRADPNDTNVRNYLASLYLNTGLTLQEIGEDHIETALYMFAKSYKLYSESQNPGA